MAALTSIIDPGLWQPQKGLVRSPCQARSLGQLVGLGRAENPEEMRECRVLADLVPTSGGPAAGGWSGLRGASQGVQGNFQRN